MSQSELSFNGIIVIATFSFEVGIDSVILFSFCVQCSIRSVNGPFWVRYPQVSPCCVLEQDTLQYNWLQYWLNPGTVGSVLT